MKILHVIDNLKLGGTQHLAVRTWKELTARGHDVQVCVLVNSPNEHRWQEIGTDPIRLACHGDYRRPFALANWSNQLAEVIRRVKPTIVHSWLWLSDVVTANAATQCKTPHLVHLVDRRNWQISRRWRDRYRVWSTRRAFNRAGSNFLAVSKAAADFAVQSLRLNEELVDVAYNSIYTDDFSDVPICSAWKDQRRPIVIGIAARIEPEKGHRYLIEALALLGKRGVTCSLKITGDGSDRLAMEHLVRERGLVEQVEFVGWVDEVTSFLAQIDVFAVPSIDSEGLPTTILEAMAAGRLVIATDVGGATEAVLNQRTGIVVQPRDSTALANAIVAIDGDRENARVIAENAKLAVAEKFSMPTMVKKIENTYHRLSPGDC